MNAFQVLLYTLWGFASGAVLARYGRFRAWPSRTLALDEPLALAEERTTRLRRLYANATRDAWDGEAVFREAVARHGGIQADRPRREALARVLNLLLWGELGAWTIAAELAERLDDADARLAASSQVFDEARHFYVLRDYMALLHVPLPPLDPYFATGARWILSSRDLTLKLLAMQILAEGAATAIFRILIQARVEPVLADLLPFVEKDESRHVGLGVMHLPVLLGRASPRQLRRLRRRAIAIGNLIGAANVRNNDAWRALGLDPREVGRSIDRVVYELVRKLDLPGGEGFLPIQAPEGPTYERIQAVLVPADGAPRPLVTRVFHRVLSAGARLLPA